MKKKLKQENRTEQNRPAKAPVPSAPTGTSVPQDEPVKKDHSWQTSLLIGLGSLLLLFFWLKTLPTPPAMEQRVKSGQKLFPRFTSPIALRELIIRNMDEKGQERSVDLVKTNEDLWVLANYMMYPADHASQMSQATASLLGLTTLDVANDFQTGTDPARIDEFYRQCNLLEPSVPLPPEDLGHTAIQVTAKGENDTELASLLIGKRPEESSPERQLRYVRIPGQDTVFIVDFSPAANRESGAEQVSDVNQIFPISPVSWVNPDFLRISRWNILRLVEYEIESRGVTGHPTRLAAASYAQDTTNASDRVWSRTSRLTLNTEGKPVDEGALPADKTDNAHVNQWAEKLSHLKWNSVERMSPSQTQLFLENRPLSELTQTDLATLAENGFSLLDHDALHPEKTIPILMGDGGRFDLVTKEHVLISIWLGRSDERGTRILAQAVFDPDFPDGPKLLVPDEISDQTDPEKRTQLEKENLRKNDENRIRIGEYQLKKAEGIKLAEELNSRLAPWLFLVRPEE